MEGTEKAQKDERNNRDNHATAMYINVFIYYPHVYMLTFIFHP